MQIDAFVKIEVVTASPDETVADAARRMASAGIGAVVVVKGGRLAGVLSERDVLTRVVGEGRDPSSTPVGEVATRDVATVGPKASLRECAEALRKHKVRHLPVVDGEQPVGMVSARDFFEAIAGELEDLVGRVRYGEQLADGVDPYDHFGGSYGR